MTNVKDKFDPDILKFLYVFMDAAHKDAMAEQMNRQRITDDLLSQRILKPFMHSAQNYYKVVYGGEKTILLDKHTGEKVAMVTREKGEKPDLEMAVLYLLLKYRGIGGKQIDKWISWSGCIYSYSEFLEWLILNGMELDYINQDALKKYKSYVFGGDSDEQSSFNEREKGFMYVILDNFFHYKKEGIKELISNAVCSETDKTRLRKLKKKGHKKSTRKAKNEQKQVNE